ncbi:MAG: CBS domain-containing protein [Acidobacteriota bacterium]|jgi:CBS domain-containing protein
MRCPLCNHHNLPGASWCEECGASLVRDDLPEAKTIVERHLCSDAVSALEPRAPQTTTAETTLADAVAGMRMAKTGCLIVTDEDGRVTGILSERELLERVALETPDLAARTVGDVMTRRPESVQRHRPLAYALQRMVVGDHRHLPVVDEQRRAVGVISSRDVIRYVGKMIDAAKSNAEDSVASE